MKMFQLVFKGLIVLSMVYGITGCNLQKKQAPVLKEVQVNFNKNHIK